MKRDVQASKNTTLIQLNLFFLHILKYALFKLFIYFFKNSEVTLKYSYTYIPPKPSSSHRVIFTMWGKWGFSLSLNFPSMSVKES